MEIRVLIVEDSYDNRVVYAEILRHAGYHVVEAVNGIEGVEKARSEAPDLILMDLSMPLMDGWEALKELKADPRTTEVTVWALSAHVVTEADHLRAKRAGFARYLTKPIEPKEVLREISNHFSPDTG